MSNEKQNVINTVMNYLDNYAKKNIENCMSVIATSTPIMIFGTNYDEVFRTIEEVRAAFNRDFSNLDNIRWGAHRYLHVEASPNLASLVIELPVSYIANEQGQSREIETLFRYALTLAKEDKEWKICAGIASVPFATNTYTFQK